jgi:hypothetical protein
MGSREVEPDRTEALRSQMETYSVRAKVQSKKPWNSWVQWNARLGGGPSLIVRRSSVEIVAPQGMRLESRSYIFPANEAVMRRGRIGLLGFPVRQRDCLRIRLDDGTQFAVNPDGDLSEAWNALLAAGVRTDSNGVRATG